MITTSLLWVVVSSCVLQLMTGAVELHGPCPMPSKGEDESALTDLGNATATPAIQIMKITRASRTSLAYARPIRTSSPAININSRRTIAYITAQKHWIPSIPYNMWQGNTEKDLYNDPANTR